MEKDNVPRYAPKSVMTAKGILPVVSYAFWPPGSHKESPVKNDMGALELRTELGGSRWYGCEKGWINSELRMCVQGFSARFEEMSKWEKVKYP